MERGNLNPTNELDVSRWVDDELAVLGPEGEWQPDHHRGLALLRQHRGKVNGRRRRWTWVVAGVMATCLSLMATPATRAFAHRCLSACVSGTDWVRQLLTGGASGPITSNVFIEPGNRTMAPDFELKDSNGKPVRLSLLRGNVILLNFWETSCAPCRAEIPIFIRFQQAYRARHVVVLGVALDEEGWSLVRPYADAKKINYPVMLGNDRISDLFGLKAVPTTFLIDRQGRIAATHIGLCRPGEYEDDIKAVLNE